MWSSCLFPRPQDRLRITVGVIPPAPTFASPRGRRSWRAADCPAGPLRTLESGCALTRPRLLSGTRPPLRTTHGPHDSSGSSRDPRGKALSTDSCALAHPSGPSIGSQARPGPLRLLLWPWRHRSARLDMLGPEPAPGTRTGTPTGPRSRRFPLKRARLGRLRGSDRRPGARLARDTQARAPARDLSPPEDAGWTT